MVIVWRVTEQCNLSCPFCAFDRTVQKDRREGDVDTIFHFAPVLSDFIRTTGTEVLVSWIGGEPLLWPPLFQASIIFRNIAGVRLSTTTNGTLLASPDLRRHVREQYAELTVSIDGPGDVHDRLRGWNGGYDQLRGHICILSEEKRTAGAGPRLRANAVLMRETIDAFPALCADLAGWGFDEITFNQLGGNDRPAFYQDHRLLPAQVDRFAAELSALRSRLAARGTILLGSDEYVGRIKASSRGDRKPVTDCLPGKNFLFIDERGMVAPCSFTINDCGIPVETIKSGGDLADLSRIFAEKLMRKQPAACGDCHSTQLFKKFQEA